MKKSIIAAGAASVALAAMPIVSTFAATTAVTDNIEATVGNSCTMIDGSTGGNRNISMTLTPGGLADVAEGSPFSITCNSTSWSVTAKAKTAAAHATDLYNSVDDVAIPAGTTFDGTVSAWAYRIAGTMPEHVTNNASEFRAITAADFAVVSTDTTGATVSALEITPNYKAIAASGLVPGTYEGGVTYTVGLVTP